MKSIITDRQKEEFYIKLYFNTTSGFEIAGIRRAFLDFSRTLEIIDENRQTFKASAENYLLLSLKIFLEKETITQEQYDTQHENWCLELIEIWGQLNYGQAQKWINMTLKYWLLFGENRIKGIETNAKHFHIPIDSFVQKGLFKESKPSPWSKISDYGKYMKYQHEFRSRKTGNYPIVDEFNFFNSYNPK